MARYALSRREFDDHLKEEHHLSRASLYISEIVYGASDGIVTTFSVVAGFAGAKSTIDGSAIPLIAVLVFGMANLFGDAVSMALGNFLSLRAEREQYVENKRLEKESIRTDGDFELRETVFLLQQKGFGLTEARKIAELMFTNKDFLAEFMMTHELNMPLNEDRPILLTGLATFVSFIVFGIIPLLPYILPFNFGSRFGLSMAATGLALILLGVLRWRISGGSLLRDLLEVLLVGTTAAGVAYLVGTLF